MSCVEIHSALFVILFLSLPFLLYFILFLIYFRLGTHTDLIISLSKFSNEKKLLFFLFPPPLLLHDQLPLVFQKGFLVMSSYLSSHFSFPSLPQYIYLSIRNRTRHAHTTHGFLCNLLLGYATTATTTISS